MTKGIWFCMDDFEKIIDPREFEKTLEDGGQDELNTLKAWLFKENIRLQTERGELKSREDELVKERRQFQMEMEEANRRLAIDRRQLKQDEVFFDKKMEILKNGFAQLDLDRRKVERDRLMLEADQNAYAGYARQERSTSMAEMLFQGVNSPLALKKRYKDLIKMFHPDNIAGDHEMVLVINKTYEELKQNYELGKWA